MYGYQNLILLKNYLHQHRQEYPEEILPGHNIIILETNLDLIQIKEFLLSFLKNYSISNKKNTTEMKPKII